MLVLVLAPVLVLALGGLPGAGVRGDRAAWAGPSPASTATALTGVPVPATGAYLGAFVDPGTDGPATASDEVAALPQFHQLVPRKLAIVSVYQRWNQGLVQNSTLARIADTEGAIPMVSWHCGDSDADVGNGLDDAFITSYAQQLKDYGRPVLLRWFWEFNRLNHRSCLDNGNPDASVESMAYTYRLAFRRIHDIFQRAGATNVAFVWCPATAPKAAPMWWFYPGDAYVAWIAADGYDWSHRGGTVFRSRFGDWYEHYKNHGKPMMVGETGATSVDQAAYLSSLADLLPASFRHIKAVVYFHGAVSMDWRLNPYSGGVAAFKHLGALPYFAPMPPA
jgi:hypothetical protein